MKTENLFNILKAYPNSQPIRFYSGLSIGYLLSSKDEKEPLEASHLDHSQEMEKTTAKNQIEFCDILLETNKFLFFSFLFHFITV